MWSNSREVVSIPGATELPIDEGIKKIMTSMHNCKSISVKKSYFFPWQVS
jgi:hypothetical protein